MRLTRLDIFGYRSLRDIRIGFDRLNVVTAANGSGKSSLYRTLRLLADVAQGRIIQSLAAEGYLTSTLWAGPETISRAMKQADVPIQGTRRTQIVDLKLGFASQDYGFAMVDSMLSQCGDPREASEVYVMRERLRGWRFNEQPGTDAEAPARRWQIGIQTPVLAADGSDLAAAIQTITRDGGRQRLPRVPAGALGTAGRTGGRALADDSRDARLRAGRRVGAASSEPREGKQFGETTIRDAGLIRWTWTTP